MKIDENIVVKCKNLEEAKDCLKKLKKLGFKTNDIDDNDSFLIIARYSDFFTNYNSLTIDINCNIIGYKTFLRLYNKEKQEKEKEQQADFEVASDGGILKINNKGSTKEIFIACDWEYKEIGGEISDLTPFFLDFILKYGLAYSTKEAREKAMFKLEIETKLKNIAERLNAGRKIDWNNERQSKFSINYDFIEYKEMYGNINCYSKTQGTIYCLDKNFSEVAKKEIGEENLIKYFTE